MRSLPLFIALMLLSSIAFARGGGGCFLPGTMVQTAQGSTPIEEISVGSSVLSFSPDGSLRSSQVAEIYKVHRDSYFEIATASGAVRATAEHPFYAGSGYIEAQSLKPGDAVYFLKGNSLQQEKVISAEKISEPTDAYNLRVFGDHTFFANGFAVHNKGGCFTGDTLVQCENGTKPISQLSEGDKVLSFDNGSTLFSEVQDVISLRADSYYEITTADGRTVKATAEHPFLTPSGYVEAKDLAPGAALFVLKGSSLVQEQVAGIRHVYSPATVYNLHVSYPNDFFANGFAVHNKGGCFLAGTRVLTPNGAAPIETLKAGDSVYSFDESGSLQVSSVLDSYEVSRDYYYSIQTAGASVLVTAEHPFLTPSGYVEAQELRAGDEVVVYSGGAPERQKITSVSMALAATKAYNLQVSGQHTFIANGFAVHNKGGGGGSGGGRGGSSSPPPNVFYLDCKNTAQADGKAYTCCKQKSSTYIAPPSGTGVQIATADYPFCICQKTSTIPPMTESECANSGLSSCPQTATTVQYYESNAQAFNASTLSCYCSNDENYLSAEKPPTCPFNISDYFPMLLAFVFFGLVAFAYNKFPKYRMHTIAAAIILVGTAFAAFPSFFADALGAVCGTAPCAIFFAVVYLSIMGSKRGGPIIGSFSGSGGEWSSTASAPRDKVMAKAKKISALLSLWGKVDPAWDEKKMQKTAASTFLKLQECWSSRDYAPMEPLLMPALFEQHTAQLDSMKARHEINRLDGIRLLDLQLVLVKNFHNRETDEFVAWVRATAKDTIVDDRTGAKIRGDEGAGTFEEFWTFQRQGAKWLLRQIDQPEEKMNIIGEENYDEQSTPGMMSQLYERAGSAAKANLKTDAMREQDEGAADEEIGTVKWKGGRVHRLLNFLYESDKIWNEQMMKDTARMCFILLNTAMERRNLSPLADRVSPGLFEELQLKAKELSGKGQILQKRNLAVRDIEIVLVRNYADRTKDEFTAWISGQAQRVTVDEKTGGIISGDEYVADFEEFWTFQRIGSNWSLKSIDAGFSSKKYVKEENYDEGTTPEMLNWYYSKDRTV